MLSVLPVSSTTFNGKGNGTCLVWNSVESCVPVKAKYKETNSLDVCIVINDVVSVSVFYCRPIVKSDEICVQVQHANKVVNSQGSTVIWKLKSHGTVIKGAIVTEVESMLVGKGNVEQVECMVRCIIRNIVKDWAVEGQKERDHIESPPACLVPGAGLGRLALDISILGFICQGN
ncbi:S-adenosyl-L-methionine-dependent methyltransferase superfamily protein [Trifolium repens]|nr:S-adenosyl-L-methionine-dependent methyltransferase superfamily protein [Trifolium repens]